MTKLTFDIINNSTNKVIASDIKTYPEAVELANECIQDCSIKSVYTEFEVKDHTEAKHRLVAKA